MKLATSFALLAAAIQICAALPVLVPEADTDSLVRRAPPDYLTGSFKLLLNRVRLTRSEPLGGSEEQVAQPKARIADPFKALFSRKKPDEIMLGGGKAKQPNPEFLSWEEHQTALARAKKRLLYGSATGFALGGFTAMAMAAAVQAARGGTATAVSTHKSNEADAAEDAKLRQASGTHSGPAGSKH